MRVAFIYAPIVHESFEENLRVVDEDFGRLPPLSLAYAAAMAEKAGHVVLVVDANALRLGLDDVIPQLRAFRPDLLGFTLSTYMFRQTTRWMKTLRDALGVPTVAGGVNLGLYPEETLANDAVDFGVVGFGTVGFPLLLAAIEGGRNPAGLPEVVARDENGKVVLGSVLAHRNPFPDLPSPARHLLPNREYYSIISQRSAFTVMVTGTGCAFDCSYCAIPRVPRFRNAVDRTLAEVRECYDQHGIREIDFFDGDFLVDKAWAREFCERLIREGMDLEWSCRASLATLERDMLVLARQAGCRQIYVGIETRDADALRAMRKRIAPDATRSTLAMARDVGIRVLGFFMLGVPGETRRTARETIRYALDLPIDYAQFSRMIAKPGSRFQRDLVASTGTDYWRNLVLGHDVPKRPPNIWSRIDDDTLEIYTHLAYVAFYYRPSYLWKALVRMRSLGEVSRSARTALRMLLGVAVRDRVRS